MSAVALPVTATRVRPPRQRISIPGDWVAVARHHDAEVARNPYVHTDVRLIAAARSAIEPSGHAHFGRGELRTILETADKKTGELRPLTPSAVKRAIARLVGGGLLLPGSWSQCLILPLFDVQTAQRIVNSPCPAKPPGGLPTAATS